MNKTQLAQRIESEIEKRFMGVDFIGCEKTISLKMKTGTILEIKEIYTKSYWYNGIQYLGTKKHFEVTNQTTNETRYFTGTDSLSKSMAYGYLG